MLVPDDLSRWSYESRLGKSLKHTVRKFDTDLLMGDVKNALDHFREIQPDITHRLEQFPLAADSRVKSRHSVKKKIERYPSGKEVRSVFNDLLGLRMISPYEDVLRVIQDDPHFRQVDMRRGKKNDDGYRGLHVYYTKSNRHYPIEIQVWSPHDAQLNTWLHQYVYKYEDQTVGKALKVMYDRGMITTQEEFEEAMADVIHYSEGLS